jgi:hypothetical protein
LQAGRQWIWLRSAWNHWDEIEINERALKSIEAFETSLSNHAQNMIRSSFPDS